jgi:hypothetical protein
MRVRLAALNILDKRAPSVCAEFEITGFTIFGISYKHGVAQLGYFNAAPR